MTVHCRLALPQDFPAIRRMLELYQYELSDIWPQELDAQGEFGYNTAPHEQATHHFAHVLLVNEHYAGVALVSPAKVTQREGYWMEQFFVLKRYRRAGHGQTLAEHVFRSHPGLWEVGQMPANAAARDFWRAIITGVTRGEFVEVELTQGWWQGTVQRFRVPPEL